MPSSFKWLFDDAELDLRAFHFVDEDLLYEMKYREIDWPECIFRQLDLTLDCLHVIDYGASYCSECLDELSFINSIDSAELLQKFLFHPFAVLHCLHLFQDDAKVSASQEFWVRRSLLIHALILLES